MKLLEATIFPKTHYVTPKETVLNCIDDIKAELKEKVAYLRSINKLVEAQRLEERTNYDIEMMRELGYCQGVKITQGIYRGEEPGQSPPCLLITYLRMQLYL